MNICTNFTLYYIVICRRVKSWILKLKLWSWIYVIHFRFMVYLGGLFLVYKIIEIGPPVILLTLDIFQAHVCNQAGQFSSYWVLGRSDFGQNNGTMIELYVLCMLLHWRNQKPNWFYLILKSFTELSWVLSLHYDY